MSGHMEKNGLHGVPRHPGAEHAQDCTTSEQSQSKPEELGLNFLGPRSECHADSDFAPPLRYGVSQHSIGSYDNEQQGYC